MFLASCAKDLSFALPFSDFRGYGRVMVGWWIKQGKVCCMDWSSATWQYFTQRCFRIFNTKLLKPFNCTYFTFNAFHEKLRGNKNWQIAFPSCFWRWGSWCCCHFHQQSFGGHLHRGLGYKLECLHIRWIYQGYSRYNMVLIPIDP